MTITTANIVNPNTGKVIGTVQATYWTDPVSGTTYKVPVGYDPQNTINQFKLSAAATQNMEQIYSTDGLSPEADLVGTVLNEISTLYQNYKARGSMDLQRTAPDGTGYGGFVPDFTPIASFDYGVASAALLPASTNLAPSGLYNLYDGGKDKSGTLWNNPINVPNIQNGSNFYNNGGQSQQSPIQLNQNEINDLNNPIQNPYGFSIGTSAGESFYVDTLQSPTPIDTSKLNANVVIDTSETNNSINIGAGQKELVIGNNDNVNLAAGASATVYGSGDNFSGGVGSQVTNNLPTGTSQMISYTPLGFVAKDYTGANGSGTLTQAATVNNNGTFSEVKYLADGVTQAISDLYDATGKVVKEVMNANITWAQFDNVAASALATQVIAQFLFKNNLPASAAAQAFSNVTVQALSGTTLNAANQAALKNLTPEGQFVANYGIALANIAAGIGGSVANDNMPYYDLERCA